VRILLVGATSALGSTLRPILSRFAEVTTAGRSGCDLRLDLSDPAESIGWADQYDVVVALAAHFGGDTDDAILEAEDANVLGTLKLCRAAAMGKSQYFVLISSIFASLPPTSEFFGVYALSKRHGEEVARFYCEQRSLPLAIVQPSQMYGDSERFRRHQPFLYTIIDHAERGEDVTIYGSHDPRRNYIHAEDVAAAIVRLVEHRIEGTFTCQYPIDTTYAQIANAAFRAFGASSQVNFLDDRPDIPDNVFSFDDALYRRIAWMPEVSIDDGMAKLARSRRAGLGN
jgi:nucleoside-diphosphate-sugar epimerase